MNELLTIEDSLVTPLDSRLSVRVAEDTPAEDRPSFASYLQAAAARIVSAVLMNQRTYRPYELSLSRHLSKVKDVDAVSVEVGGDGIIHVYSIVYKFNSSFYQELLKQEQIVERECPGIYFDFHVRARQGRKPLDAAPIGSRLVFAR
jgi:hypothetical protein